MMGETCIPRNPQRVITLRNDTLANSLALGIKPIGSTYVPGYPQFPKYLQGKVGEIESVGDASNPNLEKILLLKPDLIVAGSGTKDIYDRLSYIAPTVVLDLSFPPPSWKKQLDELAQVLGKEKVSQNLVDRYWQRVEKLKKVLGDRRYTMRVSIAGSSYGYGIFGLGEKHFAGTILSDIGVQRPSAQKGDFFYIEHISEEEISGIDGDVLFLVSWGAKDDQKAIEELKERSLWHSLKVVQRNKVYFVGAHWGHADIFAINAVLDDLFKHLVNTP
jgi:iron complex transport system substrate-binding protein